MNQKSRRLAALERIQHLLDHPPVDLGGPRPSRDELNSADRMAGRSLKDSKDSKDLKDDKDIKDARD
jgi:hypothetical protein